MPCHPASLDEDQLLADCRLTTTRRSGPGGQHRNKVETAAVLTHLPTGVVAEASERRSQQANRQQALARLRLRLALEVRTTPTDVSELWRQRRRGRQVAVSSEHADYPALVAEAFDHLAAVEYDTAQAAETLGVSGTQLVNLLKKNAAAYTHLNDQRRQRGLRALK